MDAILKYLRNVERSFEVARVLRLAAVVGCVAFMECFQEISYSQMLF